MRLPITVTIIAFVGLLTPGAALADKKKPINEKKIWQQRWAKASESEQQWVINTGACESGNNPATNTGNGYLGALQYDEQTWWAAPNTGPGEGNAHQLPHLEPLLVQRVVSIKKMRKEGTGAWPNCG